MENTEFKDFLGTVDAVNQNFVKEIDQFLAEQKCKCEVKTAKSGYTVSYLPEKTKKFWQPSYVEKPALSCESMRRISDSTKVFWILCRTK